MSMIVDQDHRLRRQGGNPDPRHRGLYDWDRTNRRDQPKGIGTDEETFIEKFVKD